MNASMALGLKRGPVAAGPRCIFRLRRASARRGSHLLVLVVSSLRQDEPDELTPGQPSLLGGLVDSGHLASGKTSEELLGLPAFWCQRLLCHVTDSRASRSTGGGWSYK